MAARKPVVKLSEQWQDEVFKCFRKRIGARMFYLSRDRRQAAREAMALLAVWQRLQST